MGMKTGEKGAETGVKKGKNRGEKGAKPLSGYILPVPLCIVHSLV